MLVFVVFLVVVVIVGKYARIQHDVLYEYVLEWSFGKCNVIRVGVCLYDRNNFTIFMMFVKVW